MIRQNERFELMVDCSGVRSSTVTQTPFQSHFVLCSSLFYVLSTSKPGDLRRYEVVETT